MRFLRELLRSWLVSRLPSPAAGERSRRAAPALSSGAGGAALNLRPHATMLDLLFCMVMLFAFQMGQPLPEGEPEAVAIEHRSPAAAGDEERTLLLLRPRFEQGRWRYREDGGGHALSPEAVLARVREGSVVPVFVLDGGVSLQRYLDAEAPLRERGLAVEVVVMSGPA